MNMEGHIRNQEQCLLLGGGAKIGGEDSSFRTNYNVQFVFLKLYTLSFYFFKSLKCHM